MSILDIVRNRSDDSLSVKEYQRRYRQARADAAALSVKARANIRRVYIDAANEAAAVVRSTLDKGASELTALRWSAIEQQLRSAADSVANGTYAGAIQLIKDAALIYPTIDAEFVKGALSRAGIAAQSERFVSLLSSTNDRVVRSVATRIWQDGYTFSERVWGPSGLKTDFMDKMKSTVSAGIAQGRDPVKIARDIQVYARGGPSALSGRWGKLLPGTKEYAKRIGTAPLDYRAIRLVRSELNASLQDASVEAGSLNPGCPDEYDWVLSPIHADWECDCEELAAGSPYKAADIPTYPHPSCSCQVRPRLMPIADFMADLKKWSRGESVGYLDAWSARTGIESRSAV